MGPRPRHADLPGESPLHRATGRHAPRRAAARERSGHRVGGLAHGLATGSRRILLPTTLAGMAVAGILVAAPSGPVQAEVATASLVPAPTGVDAPASTSRPGSPAVTTTAEPRLVQADAPAPADAPPPAPAWVLPNVGGVSSHFGLRWGRLHAGLDFASPIGTPIWAAGDGVVIFAGPTPGYGNLVMVQHENGDVTAYGHMSEVLVTQDQVVTAGEEIAKVGNEGVSTGPHLHLEVRVGGPEGPKIDPEPWLGDRGVVVDPEYLAQVRAEQAALADPAAAG